MLCVLLGAGRSFVALGIFDDVLALGASSNSWCRFVAAAIPVCIGDLRSVCSPSESAVGYAVVHLGILAVPATIIWIVGITNAVNLI